MLFRDTETAKLNRIIDSGGRDAMTEREFFAREIAEWLHSPMRMEQLKSEAYYNGRHDILDRRRTAIGNDGRLTVVDNLPNNRVVDNQFAIMVEQKANYLCGKPLTLSCDDERCMDAVSSRLNRRFQRLMKYIAVDALIGGKCWLFPYYGDRGELQLRRFPAWQVLPFWADDDHTVLDAAVRLYEQEVWEGITKRRIQRVELYKPEGMYRYIYERSALLPDVELGDFQPYITVRAEDKAEPYSWDRFPLICFKRNKHEIPLLNNVKQLQDGIDLMLSDFENGMQEDSRNTILVLKDYDGQSLGEFRQNLSTYGAVKVRDTGGVETLTVDVNAENYKSILELFKKSLIENARGYDSKDDRLSGTPNQMNIQSMYSAIDLDANGMETEFQAALDELLWFILQDIKTHGEGDFTGEAENVRFIFNRDILINESEAIENCSKSAGIISDETILEQHPWTRDAKAEKERLEKERTDELTKIDGFAGAFPASDGT